MNTNQKQSRSELVCSLVTGMVKSLIIQPFDFLRIRMQTSYIKTINILNLVRGYRQVEGLKVFLKGSSTTISGVMVASVFHLTCYQNLLYLFNSIFLKEENIFTYKNMEIFKKPMDKIYFYSDTTESQNFDKYRIHMINKISLVSGIAGLFSGILLSFITTPIDNVRIRLQSTQNLKLNTKNSYIFISMRDCLKYLIKSQSYKAIYVAFPICLLRESSSSFIYFFSFEFMKNSYRVKMNNFEIPIYRIFLFGGIAGMLNWILTLPIDFVKTKMISDTLNDYRHFDGTLDCIVKTYNNFGIKGFYTGLSVVLIRAFMVNGVVLATFEKCRNSLIK